MVMDPQAAEGGSWLGRVGGTHSDVSNTSVAEHVGTSQVSVGVLWRHLLGNMKSRPEPPANSAWTERVVGVAGGRERPQWQREQFCNLKNMHCF